MRAAVVVGVWLVLGSAAQAGEAARPWMDPGLAPERRAALLEARMTDAERDLLLHGVMAVDARGKPAGAIGSAGYFPGIARLGVPAIQETDASLGVTNPNGVRPGDVATAMPSGAAMAAGFDPAMAYAAGRVIGAEARAKGFDVVLDGGVNLTRDPLGGRNFEYLGEDPLLAGTLAGREVAGIQSQHVVSTVKHFAVNAQETDRHAVNEIVDEAGLRQSDLLAFEIANEVGRPGAVMCAYNRLNGPFACGDKWLLEGVLKGDWHYPGWVMSDWGAVHSAGDALAGLDQESGQQLDARVFLTVGEVARGRVAEMVRRVLRGLFAVGVFDAPPAGGGRVDYAAGRRVAGAVADGGIVLLKNAGGVLPLRRGERVAVIGGHADAGVLAGMGSSYVTPAGGVGLSVPAEGRGEMAAVEALNFDAGAPLAAMAARAGAGRAVFDDGRDVARAAKLAAGCDVAVVFALQPSGEGVDVPELALPWGQDGLVAAVAAANPRTVVVLETGGAVAMPWLERVAGVVETWYTGEDGGAAIGRVLYGEVDPSGRLAMSFPARAGDFPPRVHGRDGVGPTVGLGEGGEVGYRWYDRQRAAPLFPFGFGLGYTQFGYGDLRLAGGRAVSASFTVTNLGTRAGADVPQLYLTGRHLRLLGWRKVFLRAGETRRVRLSVDPRLLAEFDVKGRVWRVAGGVRDVAVGHSSADFAVRAKVRVDPATLPP